MSTILLTEDDYYLRRDLTELLSKEGFSVSAARSLSESVQMLRSGQEIDLFLVDLWLPDGDGYTLLSEIRVRSDAPVLFLTVCDDERSVIRALEQGADDYITKPFDPKTLVARVKAVTRRTQVSSEPEQQLAYNNLVINHTTYTVIYNGQQVDMPPKEFEVLYYLASNPNRVFTREQLLEQVWGYDFYGDLRTVDVHIKRLREKLDGCKAFGWEIRTVWSVGYKFEVK